MSVSTMFMVGIIVERDNDDFMNGKPTIEEVRERVNGAVKADQVAADSAGEREWKITAVATDHPKYDFSDFLDKL